MTLQIRISFQFQDEGESDNYVEELKENVENGKSFLSNSFHPFNISFIISFISLISEHFNESVTIIYRNE